MSLRGDLGFLEGLWGRLSVRHFHFNLLSQRNDSDPACISSSANQRSFKVNSSHFRWYKIPSQVKSER
jgi:hypothetical protein